MKQEPISADSVSSTDPPEPRICKCGAEVPAIPSTLSRIGFVRPAVCEDCIELERRKSDQDHRDQRIAAEFRKLKLSPKAERFTFDRFRRFTLTESQREAADLAESGASVWIWGTCGIGKTHVATARAIASVNAGARVVLIKGADLAARLRALAVDGRPSDSERFINELRSCDLFVLDDIGAEKASEFYRDALFRVIDSRAEYGLETIITSNAPPSKVAEKIGARIHSRLVGACKIIHVEGAGDARLEGKRRSS